MENFNYMPSIDDILKEVVGKIEYENVIERLTKKKWEETCGSENHSWVRTKYDLQGGKWGEDTCAFCGKTKSWSV